MKIDLTKVRFPVSCIRILKGVLDEAYSRIPGDIETKDAEIVKRLKELQDLYKDLDKGRDVSYASSVTRFAYIYKYVASHANLVADLISREPALRELFKQPEVEVASI